MYRRDIERKHLSYSYRFATVHLLSSQFQSVDQHIMKTINTLGILVATTTIGLTAGANQAYAAERALTLKSALSTTERGVCVDIRGWATPQDSANAQLWECNGTGAQRFIYDNQAKTIRLESNRDYCLDVDHSGTADGTNIQLFRCNGTNAQKFELHGDTVRSVLDQNKCVDVKHSGSENGTNIQLHTCNGTNAQRFFLASNNANSPDLFRWQYWTHFQGQAVTQGDVSCIVDEGGRVASDWQRWSSRTSNSLRNDHTPGECHTVNTADTCVFDVGDDGIRAIRFDYEVDPQCYGESKADATWLAFWIYTQNEPGHWNSKSEVDMIESVNGRHRYLNMNFSGNGTQVAIDEDASQRGSIEVKFRGQGYNGVTVETRETTKTTKVATSTLQQNRDYFFVLDTASRGSRQCHVTISNLRIEGKAHADKPCRGLL